MPLQKIFRFFQISALHFCKSELYPRHLIPEEGRLAIVTRRWGGMRWTLLFGRRPDEGVRRSRVVLTPLCRHQVRGKLLLLTDDGDNKALSPGRSRISRKPIAQGMSVCSPLTCMLVGAFSLCAIAHETAGAARTRHSLLPLFSERDNEIVETRMQIASREYFRSSFRGARLVRRSSKSEGGSASYGAQLRP